MLLLYYVTRCPQHTLTYAAAVVHKPQASVCPKGRDSATGAWLRRAVGVSSSSTPMLQCVLAFLPQQLRSHQRASFLPTSDSHQLNRLRGGWCLATRWGCDRCSVARSGQQGGFSRVCSFRWCWPQLTNRTTATQSSESCATQLRDVTDYGASDFALVAHCLD